MFYQNNLPGWERTARVVLGAGGAIWALIALGGSRTGYALAASGVFIALTGFVGFCPACALVGRRLDRGP